MEEVVFLGGRPFRKMGDRVGMELPSIRIRRVDRGGEREETEFVLLGVVGVRGRLCLCDAGESLSLPSDTRMISCLHYQSTMGCSPDVIRFGSI